MARIQSFKRIIKESVPEDYHDLVDAIAPNINSFADEVVNALNKNITIEDNLKMEYKELDLKLSDLGTPTSTIQFKISFSGRLRGISIIKAQNLDNNNYPTGCPFITFSQDNNLITIKHITGLLSNTNYKLTLLSMG